MARVQEITGKRGITYRVQFMRNGRRVGRSFERREDAQRYLDGLNGVEDMTPTIAEILRAHEDSAFHLKDHLSLVKHCSFWRSVIGSRKAARVSPADVLTILETARVAARWSDATCDRYRSTLSQAYERNGLAHCNPARNASFYIRVEATQE